MNTLPELVDRINGAYRYDRYQYTGIARRERKRMAMRDIGLLRTDESTKTLISIANGGWKKEDRGFNAFKARWTFKGKNYRGIALGHIWEYNLESQLQAIDALGCTKSEEALKFINQLLIAQRDDRGEKSYIHIPIKDADGHPPDEEKWWPNFYFTFSNARGELHDALTIGEITQGPWPSVATLSQYYGSIHKGIVEVKEELQRTLNTI